MAIYLTIELADGTMESLTLDVPGPVVVGRDPACHIVLPSLDVSRRHLSIESDGTGNFILTDSSANGTLVGTQILRASTTTVPAGTPLRVGPYLIRPSLPPETSVAGIAAPQNNALGARGSYPEGLPTAANPALNAQGQLQAGALAQTLQKAPLGANSSPGIPAPNQSGSLSQSGSMTAPSSAGAAGFRDRTSTTGSMQGAAGPTREMPSLASDNPYDQSGTEMVLPEVRKRIHRLLIENLDLASLDRRNMDDRVMRPKVRAALRRIVTELSADLPTETDTAALIDEIADEALGLGPLERLLADEAVSEIMVVDPYTIFVERKGKLSQTALKFTDDEAVRAVIERIVTPLGRRIDESTPLVDARLKDGSRVNAVIRPLALRGSCITIRKFAKKPLAITDLIRFGAMNEDMARFIQRAVKSRRNIVISGGTGSGKTTLLNVLSGSIPEEERVVTIEDAAELQLEQVHVVSLETRPPNMEGKGEYAIRDLVKNALRMRPDRIIVGECRGGEALDMLQAMNTGHEGSMTTTHANSPREAVNRLETLSLMSGLDLPQRAIREQIAASVNLVLQQTRFSDGSRRVTSITEIVGIDDDGEIELHEIFGFYRTGTGEGGKILGEFRASGYLPSFLDQMIAQGLIQDGDYL